MRLKVFMQSNVIKKISLPKEMKPFVIIWFGQQASLIGSRLTSFALGVWVYQGTNSVTDFALISLYTLLPLILISPIAGAFVDRWNRKTVMLLSDTGAALTTVAVIVLLSFDSLQLWQIYLMVTLNSIFNAFQWPAYTAATTLLVPKEHLGRASGMMQFADSFADLLAPVLGGVLLGIIGLWGVLILDLLSFSTAVLTLLSASFPEIEKPKQIENTKTIFKTFFAEITFGWRYVIERRGLLALLLFFAVGNFFMGIFDVLLPPLILNFSSSATLGVILSLSGLGMVIGSFALSVSGASKKLVRNIIFFQFFTGLCMFAMGIRLSIVLIGISIFFLFLGLPIMRGSSQVIWQTKVPPKLQGRVFAMRRMIAWIPLPIAFLVAGPLADQIFEPFMQSNTALAETIGQFIGVGEGRGVGLLFMVMGLLTAVFALLSAQYKPLRLVETDLPDAIESVAHSETAVGLATQSTS